MLVFLTLSPFQNPLSQASEAQFSEAEKRRRPNSISKQFSDPSVSNWANTMKEEIVEVGLGHHKNPERSLDRVRTWEDIEGVMGQYMDLPYPAYLPHHWDEERRHHLNYTVCSK